MQALDDESIESEVRDDIILRGLTEPSLVAEIGPQIAAAVEQVDLFVCVYVCVCMCVTNMVCLCEGV